MASALKTVMTYPLDGQTTDFAIPFDYLARKFIKLTLIGQERKELVLNTDYRFATRKTISLTQAWGGDDGFRQLEMRRYTSATERLVDFTDGSILRAYDLNVAQLQTMHIAEEARDLTADTIGVNNNGDLDARFHRIINVADATEDGDAVSLGVLKKIDNSSWQARNEAEGFRDEAARFQQLAATEASKAAGVASQVEEQVDNAKLQVNLAASEAKRATTEADRSAAQVDKAKQWADKAASEVGKVQEEVGAISGAIEEAKGLTDLAQTTATRVQLIAQMVNVDAENAADSAKRAEREADRAKSEADKVAATNQIAAALEDVTSTTVMFNREVAARSHLRSVTRGGNVPFTGVSLEGGAELYMTVDSSGNAGFTKGSPSSSPKFQSYWDTAGTTYVSTVTMNLDQGSRQIKGSLEVGHGTESSIHTFSNGDGREGEFVGCTKWKWREGGVELGTVRESGADCSGLLRTTTYNGKSVAYKQDAFEDCHKFINNAGQVVAIIKSDGTYETAAGGGGGGGDGGTGDVGNVANWKLVGVIEDEDGSKFTSKFPLTGRRGYIKFAQGNGVIVNVFFTYPPFDCTFQLHRGSSSGTFLMSKNGLEIRLKIVSADKWGDVYQFYAYNPDAQVLDYSEEVDTGYGVF